MTSQDIQEQWREVSRLLTERLGEDTFKSWLEPVRAGELSGDGVLSLYLPTRFLRDWIIQKYADDIADCFNEVNSAVRNFDYRVGTPSIAAAKPETSSAAPETSSAQTAVLTQSAPLVDSYSTELDPRFTFENFIVGKPNEFAYAAAQSMASSRFVTFNPLFLYSSVGMGKTHLMHAIAWHIRKNDPSRKVIYMSSDKFQYHFVRALKSQNIDNFKDSLRSVDVLMLDDVQFLIGKNGTQEEFFHTFNALIEHGAQIILSADKAPVNLDRIDDRLKTRLASGLVADIHPTTYELRLSILESKAQMLGVPVPQDVIEFLAEKLTTSVRELEGALHRVVANVQLIGGQVTLEKTRFILKDLLNVLERRVTIEEIQHKVADKYNIRTADILSKRRERPIARPRQIAMYLAKNLTTASLPEIGRKFDRDHTTVIHAVKTVEDMMAQDSLFADEVNSLRRALSYV